jgi:hypothetical protein
MLHADVTVGAFRYADVTMAMVCCRLRAAAALEPASECLLTRTLTRMM